MTRLYLLRHGQTDWNVAGRLQGSVDVALSGEGRAQATRVAAKLRDHVRGPVTVVSSDLARAAETAESVARALGGAVTFDARLRERAYGQWEGTTSDERERRWPQEFAAWGDGEVPVHLDIETHESVATRMSAAVGDACGPDATASVVMVSHGSALRVLISVLLGQAPHSRTLHNLANTAWSVLVARDSGGWTLERHNVGGD